MFFQKDAVRFEGTSVVSSARSAAQTMLAIVFFTFLTALSANVRIPLPFTPVPVTLQPLMVLLAGAMLGGVRGGLSQLLYVAWGVAGLPIFAGTGAGLAVLAGPTGGYLIGFVLAATFIGLLINKTEGRATKVALLLSAAALIYLAAGWAHLALFFTGGDFALAFTLGVLPFIVGEVVKVFVATAMVTSFFVIRKAMKK